MLLGSCTVHSSSHSLRYTGQYVYCSACGGYTAGSPGRKLHHPCQPPRAKASRATRLVIQRLRSGKAPRNDLPSPQPNEQGHFVITAVGAIARCDS